MSHKIDDSVVVYENIIDEKIDLWKSEHPECDISKSQSQWNACLKYIYRCLFKPDKNMINNQMSTLEYNDAYKVATLCEYYIELCCIYARECSMQGFHNLTGISRQTMYNWSDRESGELGSIWFDIKKKIEENSEESKRNRAFDNGNVTGVIALLNHDFGYNMPGVRQTEESKKRLEEKNTLLETAAANAPNLIETK